ncbi:MAG: hypothetical protein Q9191_008148 [Dirinaria sp. TL-2023a]
MERVNPTLGLHQRPIGIESTGIISGTIARMTTSTLMSIPPPPCKIHAHQLDKLFADNFALPILGYLYWSGDRHSDHETGINSATLAGAVVGQISLGILADWIGRKKVYGYELLGISVASLCISMASQGAIETSSTSEPVSLSGPIATPNTPGLSSSSMRITAWLIFFRFVLGFGIGAEYPLTAAITSE